MYTSQRASRRHKRPPTIHKRCLHDPCSYRRWRLRWCVVCAQDCPDEKRSAASLEELGGGPVKKGSLEREEGLRKRFERRWCVAWPADWKALRRPGPLLFVYEGKPYILAVFLDRPSEGTQLCAALMTVRTSSCSARSATTSASRSSSDICMRAGESYR